MKKLSLLLALAAVTSMCLASCAGEDAATTTVAGGDAATTTVAKTDAPKVTNPLDNPGNSPITEPNEPEAPALLDSTKFALDGKLDEYAGLHTIGVVGETNENHNTAHKKVTFYGAMTDAGLYLACDAYHDIYEGNGAGDWWTNSNFEFFIGAGSAQKYVYARGIGANCATSGDDVQAIMITEELANGPTAYHTITEAFIPVDYLNDGDIIYNTIDVGVAWKTISDLILGGAGTFTNGADEYWVPKGTWPNNASKAIVSPTGIWLPEEYTF